MSQIVERVSDQVRAGVLARFEHKAPTGPAVISAHEQARIHTAALADWAMSTLPPGDDLKSALDAIFAACVALNTAIAQTQLMGEVERMLAARKANYPPSAEFMSDESAP